VGRPFFAGLGAGESHGWRQQQHILMLVVREPGNGILFIVKILVGGSMRTNIDLDEILVKKAMEISGIDTKKAVIHMLLSEYIRKNNQKNILKYRGKKIWEGDLEKMRETR
jgi:Arc/MetJ family transcription regulator